MKKNYIILSALLVAVGALSFQGSSVEKIEKFTKNKHFSPTGANLGNSSGAPGGGNCTTCHSGQTQSGTGKHTLILTSGTTPVTTYTPGQIYNIGLTMTENPAKKGFQVAARSGNAGTTVAGSFAESVLAAGAVTIENNTAHHNGTSNTSANQAWLWSWTAPATNVGDVTFYIATMKANNASGSGGDVVYLSQQVVKAASTSSLAEVEAAKPSFKAGYSESQNAVIMDFNSLIEGDMFFNLVDMSGKSVFTYKMGQAQVGKNHEKVALPADLKNGMYVVNMFVNNNPMEQKIMVQK